MQAINSSAMNKTPASPPVSSRPLQRPLQRHAQSHWLSVLVWFGVVFSSLGLSPLGQVGYMWNQFWHGANLLFHRKTVDEVLKDPQYRELYGDKLAFIQRVKNFAGDYGLNTSSSYNTMVFPPGENPEVVSYLVIAAEKLSLTPVTYWFPFVGRVSYLGYFDQEDRDAKARKLAEDYDILLTGADAFSLLGYIEDPIFPSMLRYRQPHLASLIIHELVHATVWLRGSMEFNEQLAEFVAQKLTPDFMHSEVPRHTPKTASSLPELEAVRRDGLAYAAWLDQLKENLRALYGNTALSDEQKLTEKKQIFDRAVGQKPAFEVYDRIGHRDIWNNAKVVMTSAYTPDYSQFYQAFSCVPGASLLEKIPYLLSHVKDMSYNSPMDSQQLKHSLCAANPS